MTELTENKTYMPLIIYGMDNHQYDAIFCGLFRKEIDALHALIRKLVEIEYLCSECTLEDEELTYGDGDEELNAGDREHVANVLCKYANTIKDVEDICNTLEDGCYNGSKLDMHGWRFEMHELRVQ